MFMAIDLLTAMLITFSLLVVSTVAIVNDVPASDIFVAVSIAIFGFLLKLNSDVATLKQQLEDHLRYHIIEEPKKVR